VPVIAGPSLAARGDPVSDQIVYVHSAHSHLHVAVMHDGGMFSNERCNLDDVLDHETRVIENGLLELVPPQFARCRRCFPAVTSQDDEPETVTS
jgi:hypothetical protein